MENRREQVWEILEAHFDTVSCLEKDNDIVEFDCYLGDMCFKFPFYDDEFIEHNSYDIVNAIWEYIAKYML